MATKENKAATNPTTEQTPVDSAAGAAASHEVVVPALPKKVETTFPIKRTRSAHKEDCKCGVCNKKRMKAEKVNAPPAPEFKDKPTTQEEFNTQMDELIEALKKEVPGFFEKYEEKRFQAYIDNFPNDRGIVIFEPAALEEMKNNFYRLGEKYPGLSTEALAAKIINEVLIKFTKAL